MDVELARKLGTAAREARHRAGLTQTEVATRIGISPVVYSRLERGMLLPSVTTLLKLCRTLGVTASTLLGTPASEPAAPAPPAPVAPPTTHLLHLLALISQMDDAQIEALTTVAATLLR